MENLHLLQPCVLCPTRMAVPGNGVCTRCEAVEVPVLLKELTK